VAKLLANKTYVGLIDWNGVLVQGQHQPLVSPELFQQVQDLLAARSARGTRERKHHHYLKGVLYCAVCGRRYSYLVATGKSGRRYHTSTAWAPDPPAKAAAANPRSPPTGWKTRSSSSTTESNSPTTGSPSYTTPLKRRSPPAKAMPPTKSSSWTVN
jgi:hypothetical protein